MIHIICRDRDIPARAEAYSVYREDKILVYEARGDRSVFLYPRAALSRDFYFLLLT